MKTAKKFILIPVAICMMFIVACGDEECINNYTSTVSIRFMNRNAQDTIMKFTHVYAKGFESDSLKTLRDSSAIYNLPINPHSDTITYVFKTDTILEQLTLAYRRNTVIPSSTCELERRYQDIQITDTLFNGRVELKKNELTITNDHNIQIIR